MAEITPPSLDDAKDNWLVYADALQSAGDPRGELIILNQAVADGSSAADRDAYLDRNADAIFGGLAQHRGAVEIDWKYCVPRCLTLDVGAKDNAAALMKALLGSPLAAAMQTLRVVAKTSLGDRIELGPALSQLKQGLPRSCAELELVDERAKRSRIMSSSDYDPGRNLVDFGKLGALWAIPHLRRLHLWVADTEQVDVGTIDAPELRDFSLLGLRWAEPYNGPTTLGEALGAASWPKLQRLALRLPETFTYSWPEQDGAYVPVSRYEEEPAYDDYYDDEGWSEGANWRVELGGMLQRLQDTALEQLSLTSFASPDNLLAALDEHGLPPTLRVLDLSHSDVRDENLQWFLDHAEQLAKLERIDLSGTLVSDASPLRELGPEIVHSSGEGAIHRFSVGME